jgi:hypothetical protein
MRVLGEPIKKGTMGEGDACLVLFKELDRAVWQRVALLAPKLPSDVSVVVVCLSVRGEVVMSAKKSARSEKWFFKKKKQLSLAACVC